MQILFFIHKSKVDKKGLAPLKLRVTVGPGDSCEIYTGKKVDPKLWDTSKKMVTGKSALADIVNKYIKFSENKLLRIEFDLESNESDISADRIMSIFQGKDKEKISLMKAVEMHNNSYKSRIGHDKHTETTLQKYIQLESKLRYFLKKHKNREDIFLTEIDINFIEDFYEFLLTNGKLDKEGNYTLGLGDETAFRVMGRLKKVARLGFRRQKINFNPFDDFKCSYEKKDREPLTMEHVQRIMKRTFASNTLNKIKDRLIVGCFTGLAHTDISECKPDNIVTDVKGDKWLHIKRVKTDELSMIPIWPPVAEIIEKYKDDPDLKKCNRLFPQYSNQKTNEYFKEIAELCNIPRNITTHILRHTFGDFYLNSGGTLEGLAKILGHSSTTSTKIYARRNVTSLATESTLVRNNIFKVLNNGEEETKTISISNKNVG